MSDRQPPAPGRSPHQREVEPADAGQRLDLWLARTCPERTRAGWKDEIAAGRVLVNGRPAPKSLELRPGWRVELPPPPAPPVLAPNPAMASRIALCHEEAGFVAAVKPAGIPCHPLGADENGTLMNALAARDPAFAAAGPRPLEGGLVHRLDTATSGLVLVARDRAHWDALSGIFGAHRAAKWYLALVVGDMEGDRAIEWPIAHHADDPRHMVAVGAPADSGQPWRGRPRPARSEVFVLKRYGDATLVAVRVVQAQMHQIRAHLAGAGHPLAADAVYGRDDTQGLRGFSRHALHARALLLPHPDSGEPLTLTAPLPDDFAMLGGFDDPALRPGGLW